MPKMGQN